MDSQKHCTVDPKDIRAQQLNPLFGILQQYATQQCERADAGCYEELSNSPNGALLHFFKPYDSSLRPNRQLLDSRPNPTSGDTTTCVLQREAKRQRKAE